jgi:hypothetical protein
VLFYNVDPSIGSVVLRARQNDPDAGSECAYLGNQPPYQFVGPAPLQGNAFTYMLYPIP